LGDWQQIENPGRVDAQLPIVCALDASVAESMMSHEDDDDDDDDDNDNDNDNE
jgi:hypothetical protein